MSRRPYELLVFDWDGTLIDSIGSIVACTQATLDELGLDELPEAAIRQTIGLGLKETLEALVPDADAELAARIRETYFRQWVGTFCDRPILFDGAAETIESLAEAGYLLAVATGKSRRGLERDFSRVGLRERFAVTRTVDEARSKPHPQMLLDVLDELGVRNGEALMIGDTTHDLEMARAAAVEAVAVTGGSQPRRLLEPLDPLACLATVGELPGWLAGRVPQRESPASFSSP